MFLEINMCSTYKFKYIQHYYFIYSVSSFNTGLYEICELNSFYKVAHFLPKITKPLPTVYKITSFTRPCFVLANTPMWLLSYNQLGNISLDQLLQIYDKYLYLKNWLCYSTIICNNFRVESIFFCTESTPIHYIYDNSNWCFLWICSL